MKSAAHRRREILSGLFVCALFALCVVLGILQYRWITEVNVTARDRLQEELQRSLMRLSRDFDSEIASSCAALTPVDVEAGPQLLQNEVAERYTQWKKSARHGRIFDRIAIAIPKRTTIELRSLDLDRGVLETVEWPPAWDAMRDRLQANLSVGQPPEDGAEPRPGQQAERRPPPPSGDHGGGDPGDNHGDGNRGDHGGDGLLFEEPLFAPDPGSTSHGGHRPRPFDHREAGWLIFDLNLAYLRDVILPDVLQRDLGTADGLDYQVEVVAKADPSSVIYQSDPGQSQDIEANADASVSLFDPQNNLGFRRAGPQGMRGPASGPGPGGRGPGPGPGAGPAYESGRWRMFVRHRAGSLEAVVAQSRLRNLAVTGGVLLLILATGAALIRYTRRAQQLADLQMDFVTGVSHELRTPLTVIHTAAYNLQGKLANNPAQVERYGALIQRESGRLGELLEQVLQFASASSGRAIREREPLSVAAIIDETLDLSRAVIEDAHCVVEKMVDPDLPPVLGDARALRQVIENLIGNAAKYGAYGSLPGSAHGSAHGSANGPPRGNNWIGIFASKTTGNSPAAVEIRVADRGPGIPADEQEHIFEPFFRGARAVQDQIHGTGLGLSLVKKIVEAHGGSIQVKSEPMKGAEFIVRLPAASGGVAG
ncbi:MAG: HAMP domain-containing sensor histidine kinase [Bryobacteraceae bacterium]|jgi:signal transduction histidine kinase